MSSFKAALLTFLGVASPRFPFTGHSPIADATVTHTTIHPRICLGELMTPFAMSLAGQIRGF